MAAALGCILKHLSADRSELLQAGVEMPRTKAEYCEPGPKRREIGPGVVKYRRARVTLVRMWRTCRFVRKHEYVRAVSKPARIRVFLLLSGDCRLVERMMGCCDGKPACPFWVPSACAD